MSRFETKEELLADARESREKLERLLDEIPDDAKHAEVIDDLSVKDLLAHRTEWGRMMIDWYETASSGGSPDVPSAKYKWNQLDELNAGIYERFAETPFEEVEDSFESVHNRLFDLIESVSEEELFTKKYYDFTGSTDLAAYFNSATGAHYRSAYKHIRKWWRTFEE